MSDQVINDSISLSLNLAIAQKNFTLEIAKKNQYSYHETESDRNLPIMECTASKFELMGRHADFRTRPLPATGLLSNFMIQPSQTLNNPDKKNSSVWLFQRGRGVAISSDPQREREPHSLFFLRKLRKSNIIQRIRSVYQWFEGILGRKRHHLINAAPEGETSPFLPLLNAPNIVM